MSEEIRISNMDPEQQIARYLRRLERERRRYMDAALVPLGLKGDMFMVLLTLSRHPGASQDMLAEHLMLDRGNMAKMAERLEKAGYISREPVEENRRQYAINLTEKGMEADDFIRAALKKWQSEITEGLSADEKEQLRLVLGRMLDNVKNRGDK